MPVIPPNPITRLGVAVYDLFDDAAASGAFGRLDPGENATAKKLLRLRKGGDRVGRYQLFADERLADDMAHAYAPTVPVRAR